MTTRATLSPLTLLLRDWRGGELSMLLAALTLAVAVVVAISAFVSSLQNTLAQESLRFLAADQVVSSRQPLQTTWRQKAHELGLSSANVTTFSSMAMTDDDRMHLVSVKAVDNAYPLRGQLGVSLEAFGAIDPELAGPSPGEVYLAPRLFSLLEVAIGDRIWVGDKDLRVAGSIRAEPDATSGMFGYGPRLMMSHDDLVATGVVQPGSRVAYRLLLRGDSASLTDFNEWLEPKLVQGQRILGREDAQGRVGSTLDRAQGFLLLAGSLAVMLSAAAIALAARRFSERHTQAVAVMKSLGAQARQVSRLYGGSLMLLGVAAVVLGGLLGAALQVLFIAQFADGFGLLPGPIGWRPFIIGGVTALVCLGFFAWPPLRRLAAVSPLRVLRREQGIDTGYRPHELALAGLAMVLLMLWYSGDIVTTGALVLGLVVTVLMGVIAARQLLRIAKTAGSRAGSVWRFSLAGLARRKNESSLQMVIFALAMMLAISLVIIRTSLLAQWQAQLPPDTPNHFLLNIEADKTDVLAGFLRDNHIVSEPVFPMSRGRVMAVNDIELTDSDDNRQAGRQREANFTHAATLPEANKVIAGSWWSPDSTESLVSLEREFAESVSAGVGDRLRLQIGSESFTATVASIREADWQSMKPNFFVIFPEAVLAPFPKTFMTSFHLAESQQGVLTALVRQFPTVSIVELDIVLTEIQSIIARVSVAIEGVLAVIVMAGLLVLVAGIQASVDARLHEGALLRALGAKQRLLLSALWVEFAVLGGLAALLALVGAEVAAWGLQTQALDLEYNPSLWLWLPSIALGAAFIGTVGVWSCRHTVSVPPLRVLREI